MINKFVISVRWHEFKKIMLCEKIREYVNDFKFEIVEDQKDPDQRDYFVSNEKLKQFGFEASYGLDDGIKELVNYYTKI